MPKLLLAGAAALLMASCGKASLAEQCSDPSQCAEGLQCIQNGSFAVTSSGLSCDAEDRLCSIPCQTDDQCITALGAGHICISDCFQGSCVRGTSG